MTDSFLSLGLMSGTSIDGIDASIIKSNGIDDFEPVYDEFMPYDKDLIKELDLLRERINNLEDLTFFKSNLLSIEKKITLKNAEFTNKIIKKFSNIDIIGFHGQTIYHDANQKISKQLGDGKLLSQLTNKPVVYDFRQNDLIHDGQGAPLTPIFHSLIKKDFINESILFLNIGGISNETLVKKNKKFYAQDIGPGNCLIDKWIKLHSQRAFDKNGNIAKSGKINILALNQGLDFFLNSPIYLKKSYDIKDFDLSFSRGLSLEDGAATLTEFTAEIISKKISSSNVYACGGGRKNIFLMDRISKKINNKVKNIDDLDLDGDYIESQAFAFLAIRSKLNLPISFPETTGCTKPVTGGKLVKNF